MGFRIYIIIQRIYIYVYMENYHILYDKYMYYIVCEVFESGKKSSLAIVSGGVF